MPKEFPRARRVAVQLQRDLSEMLRALAQDRNLGLVSVSEVTVSPDLSHATVLVSILGADAERTRQIMAIVCGHGPEFRHSLARQMRLKKGPPQLHFRHDAQLAEAARMDDLINQAVRADRSYHPEQD